MYICIQLLRFAEDFKKLLQAGTWSYFRYRQSRTDCSWALEFCNFCIEFCKKPSRITSLMQVFARLCTSKVTLSYCMLQNTGQNVQEIDAAMYRCNLKTTSRVRVPRLKVRPPECTYQAFSAVIHSGHVPID